METVTLSRIEVKKINRRWYINVRCYEQASEIERDFFNDFLQDFKKKKEASGEEKERKTL